MAKFVSTHTPPVESKHIFEFTQREVSLLVNVLHDLVLSDGVIKLADGAYTPNDNAHADLAKVLEALCKADTDVDHDYLENFDEVVL